MMYQQTLNCMNLFLVLIYDVLEHCFNYTTTRVWGFNHILHTTHGLPAVRSTQTDEYISVGVDVSFEDRIQNN